MRLLRIFLIVALLAMPVYALAQGASGLIPCDGIECQACNLMQLVKNVLDFAFTLASFIAVLTIMYVGWEFMTSGENAGKRTAAKKRLTNIGIGFAILLSAWLIVDTGLKLLFNDQSFGAWNAIQCVDLPTYEPRAAEVATPEVVRSSTVSSNQYTATEARSVLAAAGVEVNKAEPTTSLQGINKNVIAETIRIKKVCGCTTVVTGGTESGHAAGTYSHANGYKIDLRLNDTLNSYIIKTATPTGVRAYDGAALYRLGSVEYARESDHWDITVQF